MGDGRLARLERFGQDLSNILGFGVGEAEGLLIDGRAGLRWRDDLRQNPLHLFLLLFGATNRDDLLPWNDGGHYARNFFFQECRDLARVSTGDVVKLAHQRLFRGGLLLGGLFFGGPYGGFDDFERSHQDYVVVKQSVIQLAVTIGGNQEVPELAEGLVYPVDLDDLVGYVL